MTFEILPRFFFHKKNFKLSPQHLLQLLQIMISYYSLLLLMAFQHNSLPILSFTVKSKTSVACTRGTRSVPSSRPATVVLDETKKKLTPEAQELEDILQNKNCNANLVIAQTAPSVRVAISEEFGKPPGTFSPGLLVASLKELGFDYVLDTNTAADLTVCEEGTELLQRLLLREEQKDQDSALIEIAPLPLFTSCCPGWMYFIRKSEPSLIPYISTCKSPHMMYGALVKHYSQDLFGRDPSEVYFTSVMPCIRKRPESDEPVFEHDGVRDVDNVITTSDLGELLRQHDIDPSELSPEEYDSPFQNDNIRTSGVGTGAGQLFGTTGGVMEAAVRSVYEIVTGSQLPRLELEEVRGLDGVREATISLYNNETGRGMKTDLHVAVANGLGNAKKLIKKMRDGDAHYDFVEVMACPGGCIGGGGMPKGEKGILEKRSAVIYDLDEKLPIRRSHENPNIKKFYERHLGEMNGAKAHELLHVKPVYGEE